MYSMQCVCGYVLVGLDFDCSFSGRSSSPSSFCALLTRFTSYSISFTCFSVMCPYFFCCVVNDGIEAFCSTDEISYTIRAVVSYRSKLNHNQQTGSTTEQKEEEKNKVKINSIKQPSRKVHHFRFHFQTEQVLVFLVGPLFITI